MGRTRSFLIRFTDEEYALLEEMAEEDKDAKTKKKKQQKRRQRKKRVKKIW